MFGSAEELSKRLADTGYFIDPVMAQVVFLAAKLQKPLILEGPAGSGKTQLAVAVAIAAGTQLERLQCYRSITEEKAIGHFDDGLRRLYLEFSKGQHDGWESVRQNLRKREFILAGPLMRAIECDRPCVLLVDEIDKADEGFEAMLLEVLSAWTLSIPEFGTITAKSIPFVVLTSNEERRLGDPIRRRSLYIRVEHPTPKREAEIIASRTPAANEGFHREVAGIALSFRNYSLEKPPSVSEMIDLANALLLLGTERVTEEHRDVLLPFLAKTKKDKLIQTGKILVTCTLTITGLGCHSGCGEEWADEENAMTAAEAQAFKRAASCYGLGRYLYDLSETWVPLDERRQPLEYPRLPDWALPKTGAGGDRGTSGSKRGSIPHGPIDQKVTSRIEEVRSVVGDPIFGEILWRIARAWKANAIPNAQLQTNVVEAMERASRGVRKARSISQSISDTVVVSVLDRLGIASMDAIPSLAMLKELVRELERLAGSPAA